VEVSFSLYMGALDMMYRISSALRFSHSKLHTSAFAAILGTL